MFYKMSLNKYIEPSDFTKGSGFYWVEYHSFNGMMDEITFFNQRNNLWYSLGIINELPRELLDYFEMDPEQLEVEKESTNMVSEDFALKLVAISRANANTIKVNEFLK